jgi:tRNA A37 threonylcarbamoyladenosine synthetase subunit TsaC/SUA5/YrdC
VFGVVCYAQDNLGVKKVSAPQKTPRNAPLYVLLAKKKIISRTFKISGTLIVIKCPLKIKGKRIKIFNVWSNMS